MIKENESIVTNCFLYDKQEIAKIVDEILEKRKRKSYPITRNRYSYICEVKVHKWLYILGYQKERTRDANLEENINRWLEVLYIIVGSFL